MSVPADIYAVFEDGSSSPIILDFFTPDPKDDPVRLAFPDIEDVEMRNSARNGCLAAYRVLESMGHVEPNERFFPSCQYGDSRTAARAHGASAGLAFALKFACAVYQLRTGEEVPGAAAESTGGPLGRGSPSDRRGCGDNRDAGIIPRPSRRTRAGAATVGVRALRRGDGADRSGRQNARPARAGRATHNAAQGGIQNPCDEIRRRR